MAYPAMDLWVPINLIQPERNAYYRAAISLHYTMVDTVVQTTVLNIVQS